MSFVLFVVVVVCVVTVVRVFVVLFLDNFLFQKKIPRADLLLLVSFVKVRRSESWMASASSSSASLVVAATSAVEEELCSTLECPCCSELLQAPLLFSKCG